MNMDKPSLSPPGGGLQCSQKPDHHALILGRTSRVKKPAVSFNSVFAKGGFSCFRQLLSSWWLQVFIVLISLL